MAPHFGKKYSVQSHENFDEYMKGLGVNVVLRKVATTIPSSFMITEKDGVYTIAITSTFRSQHLTFRLGEEVDEVTLDHRKCKSVFTLEGGVLTQVQRGEKDSTIVRTFTGNQLRTVLTVDDIVAVIISKIDD